MKTKDTIKKLEFKKETIARLGGGDLRKFHGGQGTETVGTVTKNKSTCTCITFTSRLAPCEE